MIAEFFALSMTLTWKPQDVSKATVYRYGYTNKSLNQESNQPSKPISFTLSPSDISRIFNGATKTNKSFLNKGSYRIYVSLNDKRKVTYRVHLAGYYFVDMNTHQGYLLTKEGGDHLMNLYREHFQEEAKGL